MADYNIVLGTNTADSVIVGSSSGDDSLALLAGNDTVTGSGTNDIISLGAGNDLVTQAGNYTGGSIFWRYW
jgi:Ca2+-binding RTX toxin-like protein